MNTHQLRLIGWAEYKRKDHYEFKKNRVSILRDWKSYEHGELVKHFALFMVVAHIENQAERQNELLQYVIQSCHKTQIYLLFNRLVAEYAKDEEERASWAKEGTEIGRAAWKVSLSTYDFRMEKVMYNVVFLYHLIVMDKMKTPIKNAYKKESVVTDKMSFAN